MPTPFHFAALPPHPAPAILGIVNVTPDSFSDTGRHFDPAAAVAHAHALPAAGADILDLGAEASSFFRPGIAPITPDEQLRRLLPVLRALAKNSHVPISIDTRSAVVARECLAQGASIINDISAGTHDSAMLATVAEARAGIILMHIGPSYPKTPAENDADILATVRRYLAERVAAARAAGIPASQIAIDPGVGFGKTMSDNWTLALTAQNLADISPHILLGISRKRFLETPPPESLLPKEKWQSQLARFSSPSPIEKRKWGGAKIENPPPHPRDPATAALTTLALQNQIPLHRLHDPALAKIPPSR